MIPCKNNFCTKFAHHLHFCGLQKLNTLNLRLFHPPLNPCNHFSTVLTKTNWYTISCKYRGCSGLPVEDNLRYADTYLIEAVDKTLSTYNIKEGTRIIGFSAFSGCFGLTSINIPEGVTSIWDYAFSGCSRLTSITIPEGVTSIGRSAFSNCSRLTSINIPEGVTSIEYETFKDCSSLSSISIPESVTSIGADAFYGCSNLTLVNIPENLASIGARAFANTPWYESMPDGIVYINNVLYCLKGKLSSPFELTIKDGTKSISNSALSGCYQLRSVSIPESVTEIGSYAFSGCIGLTSIKIPKSVNSIGDNAFKECIALNEVHISDLSAWCNIIFAGYEYTSNPLYLAHHLFLNNNEVTDLIIPDEVTKINKYAFVGCDGLKTLVIPESIKTIEDGAFFHCTELTEVELPDVDIEIGFEVFGECNSLVKPIYNSKQFVKLSEAYRGEFVIPESIETICSTAFSYCDKLTKVTIPPSVTSIGRSAFRKCQSLSVINVQGTTPPTLVATGSYHSFDSYSAYLYVPTGCEESYATAEGWKNFAKIREKDFGVKDCLLALKGISGGIVSMKSKPMTQYSFLITAEEGWKVSSISFNGSDVTSELAQDGSYTTPALTGDSELNVVFEQDGNEVKEVGEEGQLRVFASGSAVTIQNNGEPQQVSVYTTDGKAVKQTIAERGNTRIPLKEGNVYLLKIGDRTFKVAM